MEIPEILDTLRRAYDPDVQTVTLFRDSGNRTYRAQGKRLSYFVKTVRRISKPRWTRWPFSSICNSGGSR